MTQYAIQLGARSGKGKKNQPGYEPLKKLISVDLRKDIQGAEEKELNIINKILAEDRKHAWDHERGGAMFYGAAVIKTKSGQYFASANIHLQNSKMTRNCAENMAATDAVNTEGIGDMEIADLWFMGGKGDYVKNISIMSGELGRRNSPCGSCLDVIWNSRMRIPILGKPMAETRIHMLPLNDGEWTIIPDDGSRPEDLKENQVMTRTISELLPHVTKLLADEDGKIKQAIKAGWELMVQPETLKAVNLALQSKALIKLKKMSDQNAPPEKILKAINAAMVDSMHTLASNSCHLSKAALKNAKVAVVRLENGEFYMGAYLENGRSAGMFAAEIDAIQDAIKTGHVVTDLYVMSYDAEKMKQEIHDWKEKPDAPVEITFPDGATRDRLSKVGPKGKKKGDTKLPEYLSLFGDTLTVNTGAMVHEVVLNNKTDFDPEKHVVSHSLSDLLPMRYISPKMDEMGVPEVPGLTM